MQAAALTELNDEQRAAVTAAPHPTLVLAGAGSGKTRVLVHRIAWLCHQEQISPYAVVAVTFTNKAAQEMRRRVEELIDFPVRGMWLGTFHSLCHRILRTHHEEAGLPATFQVLDSQDQLRLVKRVTRLLGFDEAQWQPRQTQWIINAYKEAGQRPDVIQEEDNNHARLLRIYAAYEEHCRRSGLADFTELLLRTVELLRDDKNILARYRGRFRYILVDEFQDTNLLQYSWLKLLAGEDIPVFAVGDDDQSIYGWRGARAQNIRDFSRDFNGTEVYRLERNYRSSGNILKAANALIQNNRDRMGKNLWTQAEDGAPIRVFAAFNEREEADFVLEQIARWVGQGRRHDEVAVLYRSNAQSRVIEEALVAKDVPYKVYGGLRFFERAVVKHALAYLRLLSHRDDDPSFERIINFPPRGIGDRTLEPVRERARADGCGLWDAGLRLIEEKKLNARSATALSEFYLLMKELGGGIAPSTPLSEPAARVAALLGAHYGKNSDEASVSSVENLEEFAVAAGEFEKRFRRDPEDFGGGEDDNVVDAFLTRAALEAGETQGGWDEDCTQLMTLHSAKGLEFPLVMITGLEENLFPHERSMQSGADLEEERRLCYVGITRAQEQLVMSYAEERHRGYGEPARSPVSRFLHELPQELIEEVRRRIHVKRPWRGHRSAAPERAPAAGGFEPALGIGIGQAVAHNAFGNGVVIDLEGAGENSRALVRFELAGEKWLVLAFAKLKVLDARPSAKV